MVHDSELTRARRSYDSTARRETAAQNRARALAAFTEIARSNWLDLITLDEVAAQAKLTTRTIIRQFANKEQLIREAVSELLAQAAIDFMPETRSHAQAIRRLVEHYEEVGDFLIRLIAQQDRYSFLDELIQRGRDQRREWLERVLADYKRIVSPELQERFILSAFVATDVHNWKLLRRDLGLSPDAVAEMMTGTVEALLASCRTSVEERQ